jgi:hypothetical protein
MENLRIDPARRFRLAWGNILSQDPICAAARPLRVSRATRSITLPTKPAGLGFRRTRTNPLAPRIDAAVRDAAVLTRAIAGSGRERSGGIKIAPYVRRGDLKALGRRDGTCREHEQEDQK